MDANARYAAIVARLPPEQQAIAMQRQAELMPLLGQFAPTVTPGTMDNAAESWRGDKAIGEGQGRLTRAVARSQGAEDDFMAGISGPKYAPSAWGPIAVRQSPLMNVIKAVKSYQSGKAVKGEEAGIAGMYDVEQGRLSKHLRDQQGQYDQANAQAETDAQRRITDYLARMYGTPSGGP